jgi:hypothetical protein
MFTRIFPRGESKSVVIRGVDIEVKRAYGSMYCPTAGRIALAMAMDTSKVYYDSPHGRFVVGCDDKTIQALVSAGF